MIVLSLLLMTEILHQHSSDSHQLRYSDSVSVRIIKDLLLMQSVLDTVYQFMKLRRKLVFQQHPYHRGEV